MILLACSLLALTLHVSAARLPSSDSNSTVHCPNGSWLYVQRVADKKFTSIYLDFNAFDLTQDTFDGCRHLMEHLVAYGKDGKMETRLEAQGGFLTLTTDRDKLSIEIDIPNAKWQVGLSYLNELVTSRSEWTPENIAKEKTTIGEELALESDQHVLTDLAWASLFGDQAPSPLGDLTSLQKVELADLEKLASSQLVSGRAALAIVGPEDVSALENTGKSWLTELPTSKGASPESRKPMLDKSSWATGSSGASSQGISGRGQVIPSFATQTAMADLMAALAIASQVKSSFVEYLPSAQASMILVGSSKFGSVEGFVDSDDSSDNPRLYMLGKDLFKRYVDQKFNPENVGSTQAGLLCQGIQINANWAELADSMPLSIFEKAISGFQLNQSVGGK